MSETEYKLKELINKIFNNPSETRPIGNHHLGRHYVYYIKDSGKDYVIKFFFKTGKYPRETTALVLLSDDAYKTPKLIKHGVTDGVEWMFYKHHKGDLLEDKKSSIEDSKLTDIYRTLGRQIALIHKNNVYDCFGRLKINGDFNVVFSSIQDYMKYMTDRMIINLKMDKHVDQSLIDTGVQDLNNMISSMSANSKGYLCHNDVGDRNILVEDGNYALLIDFEQSSIHDRYRELSLIYHTLDEKFVYFLEGYSEEYSFDTKLFDERKKLYLLFHGLAICSWSLNVDKEHYFEGMELIRSQMNTQNKEQT